MLHIFLLVAFQCGVPGIEHDILVARYEPVIRVYIREGSVHLGIDRDIGITFIESDDIELETSLDEHGTMRITTGLLKSFSQEHPIIARVVVFHELSHLVLDHRAVRFVVRFGDDAPSDGHRFKIIDQSDEGLVVVDQALDSWQQMTADDLAMDLVGHPNAACLFRDWLLKIEPLDNCPARSERGVPSCRIRADRLAWRCAHPKHRAYDIVRQRGDVYIVPNPFILVEEVEP